MNSAEEHVRWLSYVKRPTRVAVSLAFSLWCSNEEREAVRLARGTAQGDSHIKKEGEKMNKETETYSRQLTCKISSGNRE